MFEGGEKPRDDWRIGTEHEKFVYRSPTTAPRRWEEPGGIRDLLHGLTEFGWRPIDRERKHHRARRPRRHHQPGARRPVRAFAARRSRIFTRPAPRRRAILTSARRSAIGSGSASSALGMWPDKTRAELPIMPKGRYEIMLDYMPKVGSLGLDMMLRTCTIQVNLDYSSEADMVKKFRVGLALQPVATALFANSPFTEGKPNGYKSFRSHIWEDTDPDRTGMLPFVFEDGFGYERYCDYALDVPMYFVYRDGKYIDVAGRSFRDFLDGKLAELPGEKPRLSDFIDHLSTAFPEVRLKSFLEMRGADGGRWSRICALPALWVGLLYDGQALDAAWDLVKHWTIEERETLAPRGPEARARRGHARRRDDARLCRRACSTSPPPASPAGRCSTAPATMRAGSSIRCAMSLQRA